MKRHKAGNWTLISLLAVLAIGIGGAVLYTVMMPESTVKKGSMLLDNKSEKKTVYGQAIDTAKSSECESNLKQIRTGISMYKTDNPDGNFPPTLKDIGLSVSPEFFKCPVSKKDYIYDPITGVVKCPTHSNY